MGRAVEKWKYEKNELNAGINTMIKSFFMPTVITFQINHQSESVFCARTLPENTGPTDGMPSLQFA